MASKLRNSWAEKIKNRLKRMGEITRGYMEEMGETGAGVARECDIDMTADNKFTNRWIEIKKVCPWFFEMRDLIGERPNLIRTGIGNSGTDIDMGALANSEGEVEVIGEVTEREENPLTDDDDLPHPSTLGELSNPPLPTPIRPALAKPEAPESVLSTKHKIEETPAGKTPARAGTSKPADPAKPPKKKSKMEEFSAIAQAEEVSRQRELELAKTKVEAAAMVKVESQKAVLQAKLAILQSKKEERAEKRRMKQDMKMEKMRLMHQLQMARLQQSTSDPGPSSHAASRSSTPGSFLPDASMSTSDASMSPSSGAGLNDWEALAPFGMFLPPPHAPES
ncbi:hypothetical protein LshimejAT787_0201110 [Lyophyllum shimeji]|uniref:Uncharacterized protein n=1 Tax=Lyophyllum shimeji TaxID=47721 RepID=A0A9P3PFK1_LYOSH|nr:hypothetical protein LshimejAT787_0201110 [Lyophyllum shimeji]